MNRPRRDTTSGRVYLDLRARVRAEGRPTDELLVLYVLDGSSTGCRCRPIAIG